MLRSTVADIDLSAIAHNFRAIQEYLAYQAPGGQAVRPPGIIAVVKANAYGHGAGPVGLALERAGATMLACADIEEAVALREAGVRTGILVFGALSVSDVSGLFEHQLTPSISSPTAARTVQAEAARRGVRIRYHLKIDTGMNRLGFRHDNLRRTVPEVLASPNLEMYGVYTHFATADAAEHPLMEEQRAAFERALATIHDLRARPVVRHTANSAALLRDARTWYDLVRPGLLLYGVVPPPLATTIDLRPALTLRSRITAVKGIRAGESVGYGARFTAARPTRIAIIPAGYADGLDVRLANRGVVLVNGQRALLVGSVCMDMVMADVTDVPAGPGDEVILIGTQGDAHLETLDVREMAATVGTIPWEVLCRLGGRIERRYVASGDTGGDSPGP